MKPQTNNTTTLGMLLVFWSAWLIYQLYASYDTVSAFFSLRYANDPVSLNLQKEIILGFLASAVVALIWFAIGIGILKRRGWARILALVSASLLILYEIRYYPSFIKAIQNDYRFHPFPAVQPYDPHWWNALMVWPKQLMWWVGVGLSGIAPAWYGIIVWYFLQPSVKAEFQEQT